MALSAKLCNPTPFPVKIRWHRGIDLNIPPMGDINLTPVQMEDFRPGKPGSATVQYETDYYGVFLYDTDKDYDVQALEALEKCLKMRKTRYEEAVKSMRDRRAAEGSAPTPELLEQLIQSFGFDKQRDEIAILEKQIKELRNVVAKKNTEVENVEFDPLTVYVIDPPRKFPSETQLNFFLNLPGNEQIKAQHEAMVNAYYNRNAATATRPVEETTEIEQPVVRKRGRPPKVRIEEEPKEVAIE